MTLQFCQWVTSPKTSRGTRPCARVLVVPYSQLGPSFSGPALGIVDGITGHLGHTSQRYGGQRSRRWMRWPASLAVSPAARLPEHPKAPMATEKKRKLALWPRFAAHCNWWALSLQRCQGQPPPTGCPPPCRHQAIISLMLHMLTPCHTIPLRLGSPISSPMRLSRLSSKYELLKLIRLFHLYISIANMQKL